MQHFSQSSKKDFFREWVKRKDHFERGCKLLSELDDERAEDAEKYREVTIALTAIDRAIEPDYEEEDDDDEHGFADLRVRYESNQDDSDDDYEGKREESKFEGRRVPSRRKEDTPETKGNKKLKRMYDIWRKWTIDKHTFEDIRLSAEEERSLTRALKENAIEDNGHIVLPTLTYVKPSKPHNRSVLPKPLSADQLAQNRIFLNRCKSTWHNAQIEMRIRLGKYLASLDSRTIRPEERSRITANGLRAIGVSQLAAWVEEDIDIKIRKKKEAELDREGEAKRIHAAFLKRKNETQVRMRQEDAMKKAPVPARFDLSLGPKRTAPVRPRYSKAAKTTLDLLRGSGMKVVHALDRGSRGLEGDLERCRTQLLEEGYVHPLNFDDPTRGGKEPQREDFDARRIQDVARRYVRRRIAQRRERQDQAKNEFDDWTAVKRGRQLALKCLKALEPPAIIATRNDFDYALRYWRKVGALLKAIDGALLHDWIEWSQLGDSAHKRHEANKKEYTTFHWAPSNSGVSAAAAAVVWAALAPRGCDVQRNLSCGGVSPLRAAMLRILKSGIDFRISLDRVKRRLERLHNENTGEATVNERNLLLSTAELRKVFRDSGLALSAEECRLVVDALDNYQGNGTARFDRVRSFFGTPLRAGDISRCLRALTYFEATCHETGMPNAYTVRANPTKTRPTVNESDITLNNGETRRRWTNPELEKRRALLKRLSVRVPHKLEFELDSPYREKLEDEDFEEYSDDNDEGSKNRGKTHGMITISEVYEPWFGAQRQLPKQSEMAQWGIWGKARRVALSALEEMSQSARHEEKLRDALIGGRPPLAPEMWAATLEELKAEGVQMRDLMTRLVVRWRPGSNQPEKKKKGEVIQQPPPPVAFFHLEFSGALGSKSQRENRFVEIACDPPSAHHDAFAFQHIVSGLEPNMTYVFRIRAFNTFGPGPYSWKRLTTPPEEPMRPVPVKLGPRGVLLRWKIPESLERRAAELRRSFEEAAAADPFAQSVATRLNQITDEADGQGSLVRRKLWLELLDEKYRSLLEFLRRARTSSSALHHLGYLVSDTRCGALKLSLLDELEEMDAEVIGWNWVRTRLAALAEVSDVKDVKNTRGLVATGEGARMMSKALDRYERGANPGPDASGDVVRFQQIAAPTTYIVERCLSERGDQYEQVLHTRFGEAQVNGLDANTSYRFRVRAVNAHNEVSLPSKSVVVNTLLETPAPPKLALVTSNASAAETNKLNNKPSHLLTERGSDGVGGGLLQRYVVSSNSVKLAWPRHAAFSSGADRRSERKRQAEHILARWTNVVSDDDGAVSLEAVFSKFDKNRQECLARDTLPMVLTKLGAHRTHASDAVAMRAVWDELKDAARDVVRTKDFAAWWNSDVVTHVLQRDSGTFQGDGVPTSNTNSQHQLITTYRGQGHATEVRGLSPNTLYRFTLRLVSSRAHSRTSAPLEVWTAPAPPEAPLVVRIEPKAVVLKWYPGAGGAHKFVLETRLVEALDEITPHDPGFFNVTDRLAGSGKKGINKTNKTSTKRSSSRVTGSEWRVAYEGKQCAVRVAELQPRAVYRVRVRAVNSVGFASAPSDLIQVVTSDTETVLTARKAASQFTRDCDNGDVVVGDTILFTERIQVDATTGRLLGEPARGGSAAQLNTKINARSLSQSLDLPPQYLGDRTVAGHVLSEAFHPDLRTKSSTTRDFRIQVVWATASNKAAANFPLKHGDVIQRESAHVTQFQTFRLAWHDEQRRRSFLEERDTHSKASKFNFFRQNTTLSQSLPPGFADNF